MTETALSKKYQGILARFYDEDSRWHDYEAEAGWIDRECRARYGPRRVRLLDLCCGSGSHAIETAKNGHSVTGIDLSTEMVRLARQKAGGRPAGGTITVYRGSVLSLSDRLGAHEGAYLLGLSILVDPIFERFDRLAQSVARVVTPGGFFHFDVHLGSAHPHTPPRVAMTYRADGMTGTLRISEKRRRSFRSYRYEWTIRNGRGSRRLRASERLRILKPIDLSEILDRCVRTGLWKAPDIVRPPGAKVGYRVVTLTRASTAVANASRIVRKMTEGKGGGKPLPYGEMPLCRGALHGLPEAGGQPTPPKPPRRLNARPYGTRIHHNGR